MFRKAAHIILTIILATLIVAGSGGMALYKIICSCENSETISIINSHSCCHSQNTQLCNINMHTNSESLGQKCCSVDVQWIVLDLFEFQKSQQIKLPYKQFEVKFNNLLNINELQVNCNSVLYYSDVVIFPNPVERLIYCHQLKLFS